MTKTHKIVTLLVFTLLAFTLTVYAQTDDIYAIVTSVDAPGIVDPGETVTVAISVEYNFPEQTDFVVGIYDPESYDPIQEMEDQDQGNYESGYELTIIAPDEEGTYELVADIFFMGEEGYMFTEGSEEPFSITVKEPGQGIPGFPFGALMLGLGLVALSLRKQLTPVSFQ